MNREILNVVAALLVIGLLIATGWVARGWREDSVRLGVEREQAAAYVSRLERFDLQAQNTLTALQDQKAAQTIIRREIIREVEKYRDRPCLDDGAVRLLQRAAEGAGSDGAAGEVPADADPAP